MDNGFDARIWLGRGVFLCLSLALIFIQLLPLNTLPTSWAGPDWLLALTLVWVARRPAYAPLLLIAFIFLLADLLFQRPPGLWAALVVGLSAVLQGRTRGIRNLPLSLEWGSVAAGIAFIALVNRAVLALLFVPQTPLPLTLSQSLMTILCYPLVVAVAALLFGITRPALGEVDRKGQRI